MGGAESARFAANGAEPGAPGDWHIHFESGAWHLTDDGALRVGGVFTSLWSAVDYARAELRGVPGGRVVLELGGASKGVEGRRRSIPDLCRPVRSSSDPRAAIPEGNRGDRASDEAIHLPAPTSPRPPGETASAPATSRR
jgi:hypothetical protein